MADIKEVIDMMVAGGKSDADIIKKEKREKHKTRR